MNREHSILPVLLLVYSFWLKYNDAVWYSLFVFIVALLCWAVIFGNELKKKE